MNIDDQIPSVDDPAAHVSDARVVYTVRELLEQIRTNQVSGFTRLEVHLAAKADKSDVARVEARLNQHAERMDVHDRRLGVIETRQHDELLLATAKGQDEHKRFSWRLRIAAALGAVLAMLASLFSGYMGVHLHL